MNFLSKAVSSYASQMKQVTVDSNNYSNQEYNFVYQKFVNEVLKR